MARRGSHPWRHSAEEPSRRSNRPQSRHDRYESERHSRGARQDSRRGDDRRSAREPFEPPRRSPIRRKNRKRRGRGNFDSEEEEAAVGYDENEPVDDTAERWEEGAWEEDVDHDMEPEHRTRRSRSLKRHRREDGDGQGNQKKRRNNDGKGKGGGRAPHRKSNDDADCTVLIVGVPREYRHETLVELHGALGLDAECLISSKFVSRGSGPTCSAILTYDSPESAEAAVETLDGEHVTGSSDEVRVLKASVQGAAAATDASANAGSGRGPSLPSLWIGRFPIENTEEQIRELHAEVGVEDHAIAEISLLSFRDDDEFRPCLVYYNEEADATNAIVALSNYTVVNDAGRIRTLKAEASKRWLQLDREAAERANATAREILDQEKVHEGPFEPEAPGTGSLYLAGVPVVWSLQDLKDFHAECGLDMESVMDALMLEPKTDTQVFRPCIVTYCDEESAMRAIASLSITPMILESGEEKLVGALPSKQWLRSGSEMAMKAQDYAPKERYDKGQSRSKIRKSSVDADAAVPPGEFLPCKIVKWVEDRAFGFVELDDYDGVASIFLHKKHVAEFDGVLDSGIQLMVKLERDEENRRWSVVQACGPQGPSEQLANPIPKSTQKSQGSFPPPKSSKKKPKRLLYTDELLAFSDRLNLPSIAKKFLGTLKPEVQTALIESFIFEESSPHDVFKQLEKFAYRIEAGMHDVQVGVPLPGKVKAWKEDRGFGFVSLDNGPDIFVRKDKLTDGSYLEFGHRVTVEVQWDPHFEQWTAQKCKGASGFKATPEGNLHVAGLPVDCNEASVMQFFSQYGKVGRVKILEPGVIRGGEAMVHMGSEEDALNVIESLNCTLPEWSDSTPLIISTATQYWSRKTGQDEQALSPDLEMKTEPPPKMLAFLEQYQLPEQMKAWLARFPTAAQSEIFNRYEEAYAQASAEALGENDSVLTAANKVMLSLAKQVMIELNSRKNKLSPELESFGKKWGLDAQTMTWITSIPSEVQDLLLERFSAKAAARSAEDEEKDPDAADMDAQFANFDQTRLYVDHLPPQATKESVQTIFNDYGFVTFCRILPWPTFPFRRAVVRVEDADQADLCLRGLHDNWEVFPNMRASLIVKMATPLRELESASEWLFVTNLPAAITADDIGLIISKYGRVKKLDMKGTGAWAGVAAKICMKTIEEAALCVECLDMETPEGFKEPMKVNFDYWMSNANTVSPHARLHSQAVRDLGKALLMQMGFQGKTTIRKKEKKAPAPPGGPPPAEILKMHQIQPESSGQEPEGGDVAAEPDESVAAEQAPSHEPQEELHEPQEEQYDETQEQQSTSSSTDNLQQSLNKLKPRAKYSARPSQAEHQVIRPLIERTE